jgi:hypothetical protein
MIPAERCSDGGPDDLQQRIHEAGLDICSVDISIRPMSVAACIES